MESDFKAGLRIAGMVLLTVGIGIVVVWSLGGFGVASAGVVYEYHFSQEFPHSESYQFDSTLTGNPRYNQKPNRIAVNTKESIDHPKVLTSFYDSYYFNPIRDAADENDLLCFWEEHVPIKYSSVTIGNITHGYNVRTDGLVVYSIFFEDFNSSTLPATNIELTFATLNGGAIAWGYGSLSTACYVPGYATFASIWNEPGLIDNEPLIATNTGAVLAYDSGHSWGDPDHRLEFLRDYEFYNRIVVENFAGSMYKLTIQRENLVDFQGDPWTGQIKSKWKIYDADYLYCNQTVMKTINETVWLYPSVCDWIVFDGYDTYNCHYLINATDICEAAEEGYFDLSGHTRSVQGNLVPGVLLAAQGNIEYSNNISFYEFKDLETGSFDLAWNKTGYHNDSISRYIGTPGDYQIDVYLIPLDALDTGEFGGRVYDYCTLEPILGAYVYLFNETADSGKYAYSNKYGFYRFAGMTADMDYEVSATKDGYDASIVHSFTFNESNINETHCKTKNLWLLPEGGCPENGIPTPPPAPTPTPHEWTNEEIVSQLRITVPSLFFIVLLVTFMWFLRKAGGAKR